MALYIGLMSGTSMDGIDVAIVDMPENKLIAAMTVKYSDDLERRIRDLMANQEASLAFIAQTNTLIGREFAAAVNVLLKNTKLTVKDIVAIGSHGQTVCHDIHSNIPFTMQLGCAHTITEHTGIQTVADFRTRDVVNGGHGAPFAPLYHRELFEHLGEHVAVVNLGGIANISILSKDQPIRGWDIGPANCLMDAWIYEHKGLNYDKEGAWASRGRVLPELLKSLLSDPFFSLAPPKSIGKEYFSLAWLTRYSKSVERPEDVMRTLSALTAHSIASAVETEPHITRLILCGGGAHNTILVHELQHVLPNISVATSEEAGISADHLEAMMFAWFAFLAVNQIAVDLRSVTGSKSKELLGVVYPKLQSI